MADLDSNADGTISSSDTAYNSLRLWRDLNQDGISQSGELFTLSSQDIASINVTKSQNSQLLGNGNEIADLGSYTKTDGSSGTTGTTSTLGDINLIADTFHRQFTDVLDTSAVASLPDMQGSGAVRDLRQAASVSPALATTLAGITSDITRDQLWSAIPTILQQWADGADFIDSYEAANAAYRELVFVMPDASATDTSYRIPEQHASIQRMLKTLEAFNGRDFINLSDYSDTTGSGSGTTSGGGSTALSSTVSRFYPPPDNDVGGAGSVFMGYPPVYFLMEQGRLDLLQHSYNSLLASVYQSLALQTRFKPLLEQIDLAIDSTGVHLDFSRLTNTLDQAIANNAETGLIDLIDFNYATQDMLKGTGWDGWRKMTDLLETIQSPAITEALKDNAVMVKDTSGYLAGGSVTRDHTVAGSGADIVSGMAGDDLLIGLAGNDILSGGAGTDYLFGGSGDDKLYGYAANSRPNASALDADELIGGTGNDTLIGTAGANIYHYNLGDGTDTIDAAGWASVGGTPVDSLVLGAGIATSDLTLIKSGNNLIIKFANAGDQITLVSWYLQESQRLASLKFADGTVWGESEFMTVHGTAAADTITASNIGTILDDVIYAEDGNDTVGSGLGNDSVYGENGNDTLSGGGGADYLFGGSGDDNLYGNAAYSSPNASALEADELTGGTGNDYLIGTAGANVYHYNLGDGTDTVYAAGWSSVGGSAVDKLVLGVGIQPSDITLIKSGSNLIIKFANAGDQITLMNWSVQESDRLTSLVFADGTVWGEAQFMTVHGTMATDTITASSIGTILDDVVYAEDGNDTVYGGSGTDYLYGGSGDDTLYANTTNNSNRPNQVATADELTGGLGNDTLVGTEGVNVYRYNLGDGADTIDASGSDWGTGTVGDRLVLGTGIAASDLTLIKSGTNLVIKFANEGDQITMRNWYLKLANRITSLEFTDGTIWGEAQFMVVHGTAATETITASDVGNNLNDVIYADDGNDTVGGSQGNDSLYGENGNDILYGGSDTDYLYGGSGDDTLYANTTNNSNRPNQVATSDELTGGLGNDTLVGTEGVNVYRYNLGDGADTIDASGSDWGTGTAGDRLVLGTGIAASDLTLIKSGNNLVIKFANGGDQITMRNWYVKLANRLTSVEFADGTISEFLGTTGTDGIDFMMGSAGNDNMAGGLGNDIYLANAAGDIVTEAANAGADAVHSSVSYTLGANLENLVLTGITAINGTGNAMDNVLVGNSAVNTLNGGAGNDTLIGGTGSDIYLFGLGSGADCIEEQNLLGTDINVVRMGSGVNPGDIAVSYDGTYLRLAINGTSDILSIHWDTPAGYGVQQVEFVDGTVWSATDLEGLAIPLNSAPVLTGGIPTQDAVENYAFTFQIPAGTFVDPDAGDVLNYSATLADGSPLPSWLLLDAASGTFSGTPGLNDADVLYLTVTATDQGGLNASGSLNINVANLVLGTRYSDVLNGTAGNDYLFADIGNDTVNGGDGNDTLVGGMGSDVLAGGTGDDTFLIDGNDSGYDRFDGGDGVDAIHGGAGDDFIRVNYFAGNSTVEKIDGGAGINTIAGTQYSDAIDLSGTEIVNIASVDGGLGNDTITGSAGDDVIAGGAGSDVLAGGEGNDTFLIDGNDSGYDRIDGGTGLDVIQGEAGDDVIRVNYFAGNSTVEKIDGGAGLNTIAGTQYSDTIDLSGTEIVNIASVDGGLGNDTITGSAGNDQILGGTGSDVLAGGAGDDVFLVEGVDSGYDRFAGDAGYDVIQGGSGDDVIRMNNFTGAYTVEKIDGGAGSNAIAGTQYSDTINLSGTDLVNIGLIDGGLGNDTLTGSANGDTIVGGLGSDVLAGGSGDDIFRVDGSDTGYDRFQGDAGYDVIQGGNGDDVIRVNTFSGAYAVERIDGGAGHNVLSGTQYSDTIDLSGTELLNIASIEGDLGNDTITGSAVDDVINGGIGSDVLAGGGGNDTFLVQGSDTGYDRFAGDAGYDTIQGGSGDDVVRINNFTGNFTVEKIDGGAGNNVIAGTQYSDTLDLSGTELVNIASIDGGLGNDTMTGSAGDDVIVGGTGSDVLAGGVGNDTFLLDGNDSGYDRFAGDAGYDVIQGGAGDDVIRMNTFTGAYTVEKIDGGSGSNVIAGTQYSDTIDLSGTELVNIGLVDGGAGNDTLTGSIGNDVIVGGDGADRLTDTVGNNLFGGGTGNDVLIGGSGSDLLVGGTGNDTITTDSGYDVIAFNTGDGQDAVNASLGADNTLSLGGGINYADLAFSKSGNNLVLKTGGKDQVTLTDWYASTANHSVLNLQVIAETMADFAPGGSDVLRDNKVETFNFAGLVDSFDQALTANPTLTSWALTNALMDFHLSGSDTDAIGGDLAYQYGRTGTLAGIGLNAAQSVISAPQFGQSAQTLNSPTTWQAETVRLG